MSFLEKLESAKSVTYELDILGDTHEVRLLGIKELNDWSEKQQKLIEDGKHSELNEQAAELVLSCIIDGDGTALDRMKPAELVEQVPLLLLKEAQEAVLNLNFSGKDGVKVAKKPSKTTRR